MTDVPPGGAQAIPPVAAPVHPPFPFARLFYSVGFAVVAWFVFWAVVLIGFAQFVMVAVNGQANDELKRFSLSLVQYLWELLAFVTFVRNEQPFPFGPFPRSV
jgi:hypothetical protein